MSANDDGCIESQRLKSAYKVPDGSSCTSHIQLKMYWN